MAFVERIFPKGPFGLTRLSALEGAIEFGFPNTAVSSTPG